MTYTKLQLPPGSETSKRTLNFTLFDKKQSIDKTDIINKLYNNLVNCTNQPILLQKFYNPVRIYIFNDILMLF